MVAYVFDEVPSVRIFIHKLVRQVWFDLLIACVLEPELEGNVLGIWRYRHMAFIIKHVLQVEQLSVRVVDPGHLDGHALDQFGIYFVLNNGVQGFSLVLHHKLLC
jgi:hypothetical protein